MVVNEELRKKDNSTHCRSCEKKRYGFYPVRGGMFIARGTSPLRRRSEERKCACELEGLVGFRSSERRWSNISTRAINISLLRSENRPSRKSLVDLLGAKLFVRGGMFIARGTKPLRRRADDRRC